MTTPRSRLLVLVVLAWIAAGGLAIGGTYAPLFTEHEKSTSSSAGPSDGPSDDGSSFELTSWGQNAVNDDGSPRVTTSATPLYGVPFTIAAAVLLTGGMIGVVALATRSAPGLRWATGLAGVGSALLLGAVGAVGMTVKVLDSQFDRLQAGGFGPEVDGGVGNGMWMLLTAGVLGAVAAITSMIFRRFAGSGLGLDDSGPPGSEPPPDDSPATPSFGVPVIRPIGYD